MMIDVEEYKKYIKNLDKKTKIKSFFYKEKQLIKGNDDFIEKLKYIKLDVVTGYNSKYNFYELLFGDMKIINDIHSEYKINNSPNLKKTFLYMQYNYIYDQKNSINYLINAINVNVCPYCQSQLIYRFKRNEKRIMMTAQIDHRISRSDNPLLSMSAGNFVPSCTTCNSQLKGAKSFGLIEKKMI